MDGLTVVKKVWNGRANLAEYKADGPSSHVEWMALRYYNPEVRQWGAVFATPSGGTLSVPCIGEFRNGRVSSLVRVYLLIQLISQVLPSSSENACSEMASEAFSPGKQMEVDLDKELRFPFESQITDKLHCGIAKSGTRRLTRLEFGGIEQIKEDGRESRGTMWLESAAQHTRYGLRELRGFPGLSITAALTRPLQENMKRILVAAILVFIAAARAVGAQATANPIAFIHVAVVDVLSGEIDPDMTVLVQKGKISQIGSSKAVHIPKGTTRIKARGKFLIPGLWDMHVHSLWDASRPPLFFPLFLANCVTGVREMGGPMPAADQVRWRDEFATSAMFGPRSVVPGPFVDGPNPIWPGSIKISTEEDGERAVDSLKGAGVDFIKVYTAVPRPAYFGIAKEAHKDHIPFAGHVPVWIGADEASNAGQKSIEHLMGILLYTSSKSAELTADLMKGTNINLLNNEMVDTYDPSKAAALYALFATNQTWQVPTLTIRHARPYLQDLQASNDPRLKYMPWAIVESWGPRVDQRQPTNPEIIASRRRLFQKELEVVGSMNRAGVKILAGTDTPNPYCFPGFSLHDELGFMVQAGLTNLEALQTATINPAEFLGTSQSFGTIEKGKVADLVLLEANPLDDIANTKRIAAVVTDGRLVDRNALDALLARVADKVAHNAVN